MEIFDIVSELDKSMECSPVLGDAYRIGSYYIMDFGTFSFPVAYDSAVKMLADGSSHEDENELEFLGYIDALTFLSSVGIEEFHENTIRALHRKICYRITSSKVKLGDYKTIPNNIMSGGMSVLNRGQLLIKTSDPWRVVYLLKKALYEFHNAKHGSHVLINIGMFIGAFLHISPFQKGNISLIRALTIFLLNIFGYKFACNFVIWNFLDIHDPMCREALLSIPTDSKNGFAAWNTWLSYFLGRILFFKDMISEAKVEEKPVQDKNSDIELLSDKILKLFVKVDAITIAKICELTGANRNTVKLHLKNLVHSKEIVMHGSGRGVWYTLKY